MSDAQALHNVGSGKTKLDAILPDEPWGKRSLGEGVNVVTGQTAVPGVERFEIVPGNSWNTDYEYSVVTSESTYESAFSTQVSASYNTQYSASASASFMSNVQYSSTSMTMIVTAETTTAVFGTQSDAPRLTEAAQIKARENPEGFRDIYGDYYVDNAKSGGRLVVVYTFYASSSASLTAFSSSASFGTGVFNADAAVSFSEAATAADIQTSISVTLEGASVPPFLPTSIEDVPRLVDWFLEEGPDGRPLHITTSPRIARLVHYSALDQNIPIVIDVDPTVFTAIQILNSRVVGVSSQLEQLPDYYGRQMYDDNLTFAEKVTSIRKDFYARAFELPTDKTDYIDRVGREIRQIFDVLEPATVLFAFYENLIDGHEEPSEGKQSAQYGWMSDREAPVPLKTWGMTWKAPAVPFRWYDHYVNWPVDNIPSDNIIVGWRVDNQKGVDTPNGEWKRKTALVGKRVGQFYLSSNAWYEAVWHFEIIWVPISSFPWLLGHNGESSAEPSTGSRTEIVTDMAGHWDELIESEGARNKDVAAYIASLREREREQSSGSE